MNRTFFIQAFLYQTDSPICLQISQHKSILVMYRSTWFPIEQFYKLLSNFEREFQNN